VRIERIPTGRSKATRENTGRIPLATEIKTSGHVAGVQKRRVDGRPVAIPEKTEMMIEGVVTGLKSADAIVGEDAKVVRLIVMRWEGEIWER